MIESAEEFIRLREANDERASHDHASDRIWHDIIKNYPEMRFWVAHNRTIRANIVEVLAKDDDSRVRYRIATNRCLNKLPQILEQLASDVDDSVRLAVVRHKATPKSILQKMKNDSWEEVGIIASKRLGTE